ncbi:MAG: hypothetical protein Fur0041_17880 [Bacteroidia bacterium]
MVLDIEKYTFRNELLLELLPKQIKKELLSISTFKKLKKRRLLYREGTFPKGVYIIQKGKVKIFQTNSDGRSQIMYIYQKGDILGYRPMISNDLHPVTAEALEELSYFFIPREHFLKTLYEHPEFMKLLLAALSHEFAVWINNITVFAQQPVKQRVALGLLILQNKYRQKGAFSEINLSRDDFASYIGTVKETLVRVLKEFKVEGWIVTKGRNITITDYRAIERIASGTN